MSKELGVLIVQEAEPSGNLASDEFNAIWIKVSTNQIYKLNKETGLWDVCPIPSHGHTELGNINFIGTISTAGQQGLTGSRTIGGLTITFKNGLLVGFSQ